MIPDYLLTHSPSPLLLLVNLIKKHSDKLIV